MGQVAEPDSEGSGDGAPDRKAKIITWPSPPPAILPQSSRARSWILGLAFLVSYLSLRTSPPMLKGYESDVEAYARWFTQIGSAGLRNVYARSDFDYPPLFAYLLWAIAKGQQVIEQVTGATLLLSYPFLLRLWPLTFDLMIGGMLFALGRAVAGTAAGRLPWGWILALIYLLNPAVLFDTGYWGQTDSIHSAFVLAGFLALGWRAHGLALVPTRSSPSGPPAWMGWVLLALGALMKPLALPFLPLFLLLSVCWHGVRKTIVGLAAAAATVVVLCAPFALSDPRHLVQQLVMDVGSMPFTSVNAHNLWWIFGAWRPADEPWIGSLTATEVGCILFGTSLLVLLIRTWQIARQRELSLAEGLGLAAALGMGFFMLSTHMHENHFFACVPLLIPLAVLPWAGGPARTRAALWLVAGVTVGLTLNMVNHDPWLMMRGPGAESVGRMDPTLALPNGTRRKLLAAVGTGINVVTWMGLMRCVFTDSPVASRRFES